VRYAVPRQRIGFRFCTSMAANSPQNELCVERSRTIFYFTTASSRFTTTSSRRTANSSDATFCFHDSKFPFHDNEFPQVVALHDHQMAVVAHGRRISCNKLVTANSSGQLPGPKYRFIDPLWSQCLTNEQLNGRFPNLKFAGKFITSGHAGPVDIPAGSTVRD
jgi:hypothetical protein